MKTKEFDLVVVGGGIVGLSSAYFAAQSGKSVCLVERGDVGQEASWAGGGILSPIHPNHYPPALAHLCEKSLALYPNFVQSIEAICGFSAEFRHTGMLRVDEGELSDDNQKILEFHQSRGKSALVLDRRSLLQHEPRIGPKFSTAIYEANIHQVRNPRLLKGLYSACVKLGVVFNTHCSVLGLVSEGDRTCGVETDAGTVHAKETLVAAGPWSAKLCRSMSESMKTDPVHGAMILIDAPEMQLKSILIHKGFYIIPRADGQIVVGSTLEHRGFDKKLKLSAVLKLLQRAIELVPDLADCHWKTAWTGLRPSSQDRLPYIGRPDNKRGLIVASGHYRNGLLLGPVTGKIVSQILDCEPTLVDLEPFRLNR